MRDFCTRCGTAAPASSRFCGSCGADLRRDAGATVLSAHDLRDVTEEIPAVRALGDEAPTTDPGVARPASGAPIEPHATAPADPLPTSPSVATISDDIARILKPAIDEFHERWKPMAERWWVQQRSHSARNSVAVCGLLLLLAITLAWTAGRGDPGLPTATKRTASTHPAPRTRTPKPIPAMTLPQPAAPDPRVQGYVAQFEGILQQSAAGRTQLASTVASVQPSCGAPQPQAQQGLTTVVANRSGLVHQLDVLGPGPDPATQLVSSVLHQALEASTQADVQYRDWATALGGGDGEKCKKNPSAAAALAAAHADDSTASTLKTQFVGLFNPLAAALGLPGWSPSDF